MDLSQFEVWFITGSQHLYGPEAIEQVGQHSSEIAAALNDSVTIPTKVVYKPVAKTPEEIMAVCVEANNTPNCVGVITWMHTFSPAKMWIGGLTTLKKPMAHLHTQYNRDIPWADIDMDFMNLNQAAHGDREFGFMVSRLRMNRKVVVGHWQEQETQNDLAIWARVACALHETQSMRVVRFGDNMRSVAVTEGDKVEAQIKFGYQVHGHGIGDLVEHVNSSSDADLKALIQEYEASYVVADDLKIGGTRHSSIREAARIELGIRSFLKEGNYQAFTTTFEDLHGLAQLPGLAPQRLMADGIGFAGEGDWKTAALLRTLKVMTAGLDGGTSFMEDYTYHMDPSGRRVLGSHMLEICPSIAAEKPSLEVHPLGIGGKADPARLVFNTPTGFGLNVSVMDMGNRFRMVVNEVDVVEPNAPLPKLPVARAVWEPRPDFKTALAAWIYAGGAHHTVFSQAITSEYLADFADMAGIEFLLIDGKTDLRNFKNEIRWNDATY